LQDVRERRTGVKQEKVKSFEEMKDEERLENVLMIIQVPLKQKPKPRRRANTGSNAFLCSAGAAGAADTWGNYDEECYSEESAGGAGGLFDDDDDDWGEWKPRCKSKSIEKKEIKVKKDGMDMGILSLGTDKGEFVGTKGLKLERDERFPIRCTLQYYRLTDDNKIDEATIKDIKNQNDRVEAKAIASGSLVFSEDKTRKTEADLDKPKPSDTPFKKLEERDYLKDLEKEATKEATKEKEKDDVWKDDKMASFL